MATFPFNSNVIAQTYTWRDAKGNTANMKFYIDFTAGTVANASTFGGALVTLLDALTNAAIQSAHGPAGLYGVLQYGAHPAEYQSVEQKAVLVFQDSSGQLHRFKLPAPVVAMFLADQQTVNPAFGGVASLITKLTTADVNGVFAVSRQDLPFSNYIGGFYATTKLRRRLNVTVLTPALTPSTPAE